MASEPRKTLSGSDEVLRLVPLFALGVAILAVVVDPSSSVGFVLAAVPVAAFVLWAYAGVPLWALCIAVIAPVVFAQRGGELEPLFFEVSLLAYVIGRTSKTLPAAIVLGLLAAASPIAVSAIQTSSEINVGIWVLGIAVPWALARGVARQAHLSGLLVATRHELAHYAVMSEQRRVGRDAHDFVGQGLADVMLQVTSARHVLRRDPAAAEEGLRAAEELGRHVMQELRRTVSQLRCHGETADAAPPRGQIDAPTRRRGSFSGTDPDAVADSDPGPADAEVRSRFGVMGTLAAMMREGARGV